MDVVQLRQHIGRRLRTVRRQLDLSQEELAERAQLHPTYISRIESGRSLPALDVLIRLSKGLGCSLGELLLLENESELPFDQADEVAETVTAAQIYGLLDSCTPQQLRLIKELVEVVRRNV